jgi:hypothetical protein
VLWDGIKTKQHYHRNFIEVVDEPVRHRDDSHLAFIRTLPCVICGDNTTVEAAHIRRSDARIGKPITGIGIKPDDKYTLPLCGRHHREEQKLGEGGFWPEKDDPIVWALAIYSVTGDPEEAERIIKSITLWHHTD